VRCPSHRGRRLIAANCHLGEDACARQLDGEVALAHTDGAWVSHAVAPAPCAGILTTGRHDGAHCRRVRPIAELGRSRRRIGPVDRVRTLMSRLPPGAKLVPIVAPAVGDGGDDAAGELVAGGDLCPASPRELQRRSAATTAGRPGHSPVAELTLGIVAPAVAVAIRDTAGMRRASGDLLELDRRCQRSRGYQLA
jgi:hypothetical protein